MSKVLKIVQMRINIDKSRGWGHIEIFNIFKAIGMVAYVFRNNRKAKGDIKRKLEII